MALACATIPVDPKAPLLEEQPLVTRAEAWCEEQGHPAGVPEKPFSTDGCTLWPDGTIGECCVTHDIAYWCGGTSEQRVEADRVLAACAVESGYRAGWPVYAGVRMGGSAWLPTTWRWGYGHPFGHGYAEAASPEEP